MELKNKRNMMLNANIGGGTLPSEYQRVEYIESTGKQYIKTDYIPSVFVEYECRFSTKESTNDTNLFGVYQNVRETVFINTSNGKGIALHIPNSNNNSFIDTAWRYTNLQVDTFYNLKFSCENKSNMQVDDVQYYGQATQFTAPIWIFTCNGKNNIGRFKISKFIAKENNTETINLIPCYRIADNEIGMYDLVSNTFYTNAGTGTFIKGPDVNNQ